MKVAEGRTPAERAMLLMGMCGLRIFEAVALDWQNVNLTAGVLTVVKDKGGKKARVVPPQVVEELRALGCWVGW